MLVTCKIRGLALLKISTDVSRLLFYTHIHIYSGGVMVSVLASSAVVSNQRIYNWY